MQHVIRILERYGIASLASLEREAAGGALSRIPAHVLSESERAKLAMAAEILAASRGSSASASASSPSTSASSQPSRLAQVEAPTGSGSGNGNGRAPRKPKENPFCTPLLSRARPPRLAAAATGPHPQLQAPVGAAGARDWEGERDRTANQLVQQQAQQPNISPSTLQNLHNEFVALSIGSAAQLAHPEPLSIALSQRSIPARPDTGDGDRSQRRPRLQQERSLEDDPYMNSCSVLLPSPDLPDLQDGILEFEAMSPDLPPPPHGPNATLDLPHRRTSGGGAAGYAPYGGAQSHRQLRSQSESRQTRAEQREESEDGSLSPDDVTREWIQSQERCAYVSQQQQQQQNADSGRTGTGTGKARGWVCYASFGPETAPAAALLPPAPALPPAGSSGPGGQAANANVCPPNGTSTRHRQSSQSNSVSNQKQKQQKRGPTAAQKTGRAGRTPPPSADQEGSSYSPVGVVGAGGCAGLESDVRNSPHAPEPEHEPEPEHDEDEDAVLVLADGRWDTGDRKSDGDEVYEDEADTRASSPVFVPRTSSDDSGSRGRTQGPGPTRPTGRDREATRAQSQDTHPNQMHTNTKLSATLRDHFDTGDSVFDRI